MTTISNGATATPGFAVRLTATLPKGERNGLRYWARLLAEQPTTMRYAICQIDTARKIEDVDADTDTAVVRILRVEVVASADIDTAGQLMLSALTARGGDVSLFDEDDDERVDDESGEVDS